MSFRRMFDKINRYRWAGLILMIPTVWNLILHPEMEITIPRVIYWIGLATLLVAVASDYVEVYRGKRKVRKMIDNYLTKR